MSVHIEAKKGDIAETILLPGDPLRAKWIAETFLENPICFNKIRGMLGFTGTYNNKKVSVMGTGMGVPSISIYAHELINEYDVKNLIRVGSAGSYQKHVKIRDIVLAMAASSNSGVNELRFGGADYAPTANFELFQKAVEAAKAKQIPLKAGNVFTIEPGIYIKEESLGIRLEDDILVGNNNNINLMEKIPIQPEEIEDIMN